MYDIMLDLAIVLALLSLIYPGLFVAAVVLGVIINAVKPLALAMGI